MGKLGRGGVVFQGSFIALRPVLFFLSSFLFYYKKPPISMPFHFLSLGV